MTSVAGGDGPEGGQPVGPGLPDAHQEPGGERDAGLTGGIERGQPAGRRLVRGRPVRGQIGVDRLDHHPLAGRDLTEPEQVREVERPGVGVGEQARLVDDGPARGHQVVDGRGVAVVGKPLAGRRVAVLGSLTQGEQGLVAARRPAGPGDRQHLVEREVGRLHAGRGLGEGAVAAPVAAQHGERDEDLGGEGHPVAVGVAPDLAGLFLQRRQREVEQPLGVGGSGDRRHRRCRWRRRVRRQGAGVGRHRRHLIGGVLPGDRRSTWGGACRQQPRRRPAR